MEQPHRKLSLMKMDEKGSGIKRGELEIHCNLIL
jgi:hypothetical protein